MCVCVCSWVIKPHTAAWSSSVRPRAAMCALGAWLAAALIVNRVGISMECQRDAGFNCMLQEPFGERGEIKLDVCGGVIKLFD